MLGDRVMVVEVLKCETTGCVRRLYDETDVIDGGLRGEIHVVDSHREIRGLSNEFNHMVESWDK